MKRASPRHARLGRILRVVAITGVAAALTAATCGNSSGCGPYADWSTTGLSATISLPAVCPVPIASRAVAEYKDASATIKVDATKALEGAAVSVTFANQNGQNVNYPTNSSMIAFVRSGVATPGGLYLAGSGGPRSSPDQQWDKTSVQVPLLGNVTATGSATLKYTYETVASVTGPGSGLINTPYTYTASIKSGKSPFRFEWYIDGIKKPGTANSYVYSGLSGTHSIRVDVWDVENDKGSATTTVVLNNQGGGGGSTPPPCDPGGGSGNPEVLRSAPGVGPTTGVTKGAPGPSTPARTVALPPC